MALVDPGIHMWITLAFIGVAVASYALEKISLELTSLAVVAVFLVFFYTYPVIGPGGDIVLGTRQILSGFADPALFTILALLVIGQGLVRTGALDDVARLLIAAGARRPQILIIAVLLSVMILSAIMNNTPVVVIFIPILSALASQLGRTASHIMIPLSFIAILGGNLTLIGSSTNLLVSGTLESLTGSGLDFFALTLPGLFLAAVGAVYVIFVVPKILSDRSTENGPTAGISGRQFVVQLHVNENSHLVGEKATSGMFKSLPQVTVRMVQRDNDILLPPFENVTLQPGDVPVVAATRATLTELLKKSPDLFEQSGGQVDRRILPREHTVLAEVMITPASRLDGQTLTKSGLQAETNCNVLGVQRRSHMVRKALDSIRLQAGDVLLILGRRRDVLGLRANRDVVLLIWSATDLPMSHHAGRAIVIFAAVIALSASGLMPIVIAAISGAALMIAGGCLNIHQAARAVDRRIFLLIGAALAMGTALTATGGASYLAEQMIKALEGAPVTIVLSAFFLMVAIMTNMLSNNATAVLFTPIALSVAQNLGVPPMPFVLAVVFAANCSFATPMGYQTNLLVMGPGHYRFVDYLKVGVPLVIIIWAAFSIFAPWYFDLI